MPAWRRDGAELYYIAPPSTMRAVNVGERPPLTLGDPVPLFDARVLPHPLTRQYEVSSDGNRFLLNRRSEQRQEPISLVLSWQARLVQ